MYKIVVLLGCSIIFFGCSDEPLDYLDFTDDERPDVEILSPAEMETVSTSFMLKLTYYDFFGVSQIQVFINDTTELQYKTKPNFSAQMTLDLFKSGINTIKVRVLDNSGNYSKVAIRKIFVDKPSS